MNRKALIAICILFGETAFAQVTLPTTTGELYKRAADTLIVYNKDGETKFQISHKLPKEINSVMVFGNYCYVEDKELVWLEFESESYMSIYYVYNRAGELLKTEQIAFNFFNKSDHVVPASIVQNNWYLSGVYDLERAEYVIAPSYDFIEIKFYSNDLAICYESQCSYYFEVHKGKKVKFFDKNLSPIKVKTAIPKKAYDELTLAYYKSLFEVGNLAKIHPIEKSNPNHQYFLANKSPVTLIIAEDVPEKQHKEAIAFYGYKEAIYKNIEIVAIYNINTVAGDKPLFGLKYTHLDRFILSPVFDSMSFNISQQSLNIQIENKSGKLLLERYENE